MRLIDADNINGCAKYIKTNENFEPYIMIDDLVKLLDEQPTVYDVDKVVEQIHKEQEREFINNEVAIGDITCSEVVEIVKGGGVNVKHK